MEKEKESMQRYTEITGLTGICTGMSQTGEQAQKIGNMQMTLNKVYAEQVLNNSKKRQIQ